MAFSSLSLLLSLHPPNPIHEPLNPILKSLPQSLEPAISKRHFVLKTASLISAIVILTQQYPVPKSSAEASPPPKPAPLSIANTKSWFQFYGDGFAIRIPPQFQDITEPEDYDAGTTLYGDKAKPKKFAARFESPDGLEAVSVVIRPTNQLKITFLEAQDITDLGSLKEAAKIFVPGGANIYSARTIKIKEEEGFRTYYFYEFGDGAQHLAIVAAVNGGKAFIAGATAPQTKWEDDGVKLRSAAVSLTVL
uniref:Photosystem II reaction center PsbP family protein n=1 Tax=Monsonia emarginata TaxID=28966 RepID=A0A0F7GX96_9ROSI